MDALEVFAQATVVAQTVLAAGPTPTPSPSGPTSLFPSEVGYLISAVLGGLASFVVNKITTRQQTSVQLQIAEENAQREREAREEERYRQWRHDMEQGQANLWREVNQHITEINIALLKVERSVHEIEEYIEPIKTAVRTQIQRRFQGDDIGS